MTLPLFLYTAMQQVLDNLSDLPNSMGAGDLDLIFLRGLMESPIVRSLAKVQLNGLAGPETLAEQLHLYPLPSNCLLDLSYHQGPGQGPVLL